MARKGVKVTDNGQRHQITDATAGNAVLILQVVYRFVAYLWESLAHEDWLDRMGLGLSPIFSFYLLSMSTPFPFSTP